MVLSSCSRRRVARPLLMAAAILAVAGGLAVWERMRREGRVPQVRSAVVQLVDDVRAARRPALLEGCEPVLARTLGDALSEVVDGRDVSVEVVAGDLETDADLPERATHVATLRRDGAVLIRLRLAHPGRSDQIAIIGFWRPPET